MSLTLAIIVASVSLSGSAVVVSSLRFAKWLITKDREDEKPVAPGECDDFMQVQHHGNLKKCPVCGKEQPPGKKVYGYIVATEALKEFGLSDFRQMALKHDADCPTSADSVLVNGEYRLRQMCCKCGACWLTLPVSDAPKTLTNPSLVDDTPDTSG